MINLLQDETDTIERGHIILTYLLFIPFNEKKILIKRGEENTSSMTRNRPKTTKRRENKNIKTAMLPSSFEK